MKDLKPVRSSYLKRSSRPTWSRMGGGDVECSLAGQELDSVVEFLNVQ